MYITNTRTHTHIDIYIYIYVHTILRCIYKLKKTFRFGRISSQGPGKPATSFHHRLEDIFVDLKITPQFPRTESLQHEPGRITCLHRLCSEDGYFIFRYSRLQLDISLDKSHIKEKSGHHLQFQILRTPLGGHIIFLGGGKTKKTPATKPLASFQVLPWWRFALLFHQRASLNASCQGSPKVLVVTQTSRGNKITRKFVHGKNYPSLGTNLHIQTYSHVDDIIRTSPKLGYVMVSRRKWCLVPMNCPFHFKVILKFRGVASDSGLQHRPPYVCHFEIPTLLTASCAKSGFTSSPPRSCLCWGSSDSDA